MFSVVPLAHRPTLARQQALKDRHLIDFVSIYRKAPDIDPYRVYHPCCCCSAFKDKMDFSRALSDGVGKACHLRKDIQLVRLERYRGVCGQLLNALDPAACLDRDRQSLGSVISLALAAVGDSECLRVW